MYRLICAAHNYIFSTTLPLWTHHSPASPATVLDRQSEIPGFPRVHAKLQAQRIVACSGETERPYPRVAHRHRHRHEDGLTAVLRQRGLIMWRAGGGLVRAEVRRSASPTTWTQRHLIDRNMKKIPDSLLFSLLSELFYCCPFHCTSDIFAEAIFTSHIWQQEASA